MARVPVPGIDSPTISLGYPSVKVCRPLCASRFPRYCIIYDIGLFHCRLQLLTRAAVDYSYVDETADIARHYSIDSSCESPLPWAPARRQSMASPDHQTATEPSLLNYSAGSHSSEPFLSSKWPEDALASFSPYRPLQLSPDRHSSIPSASPHFSHSSNASPGSRDFIINSFDNRLPSLNEHEACLMRYFVVQLAPWVGSSRPVETSNPG